MLPKPEDLKTSQKGYLMVFVPLGVGLIFLIIMSAMVFGAQKEAEKESYTKSILLHQQAIDTLMVDSLSAAYNSVLIKSESPTSPLKQITTDLEKEFNILFSLVKEDKDLAARVQKMHNNATIGMAVAHEIEASRVAGSNEFMPLQMQKMINRLRKFYDDESKERQAFSKLLEEKQKNSLLTVDQWRVVILAVLLLGVSMTTGLSIAGAILFGTSMGPRLRVILDNSIRLAAGQELNPPLHGKDEIARLDEVFHGMARSLKAAQRREQAIVENSGDVICSIDHSDRFTAINSASLRVWGFEPAELLGRYVADILVKEDVGATREAMKSAQQNNLAGSFENRVRRKEGQLVAMLWSITWSGPRKAYYCVAHDITRRRMQEQMLQQSEKRVQLILQSMPVGVAIGTEGGRIELVNQKMEEMFEYTAEELDGMALGALFPSSPLAQDEQFIDKLQDASAQGLTELDATRKDGVPFPAQISVSHFFIQGEVKPLVVIADISSRREVEKMKQEILAMVSHDLRAPLTTLNITLQLLKGGTLGQLNDRGSQRVVNMEREVERLMGLINNLLDLEKIETQGFEVRKEVVSFEAIVNQSLLSVGYLAEKNGVQLLSDVTPAEAFADSSGLVQVIVNLIANAIKFSPTGSTVTISCHQVDTGVLVSVKDQGRGIPDKQIDSIFDRFKQVEIVDRTEKKGSGLGLAICKSIVEAHGGTISVESKPGEGSTFSFLIPVED